MNKFWTKKKVLLVSTLGLILILGIGLFDANYPERCRYITKTGPIIGHAVRYCENLALSLSPFLSIFLFSLITYKMRDAAFTEWMNFTRWWVPLTIVLTLIMPSDNGSFFPADKGHVALIMTALYTFLSLVVVWSVWTRKEKK